jgi:hypothetical protein
MDHPPKSKAEEAKFSNMFYSWGELNSQINLLEVDELVRLIHYGVTKRPQALTLLRRIVQRFNSVNKITLEDLEL